MRRTSGDMRVNVACMVWIYCCLFIASNAFNTPARLSNMGIRNMGIMSQGKTSSCSKSSVRQQASVVTGEPSTVNIETSGVRVGVRKTARYLWKRVRSRNGDRSDQELRDGIANFYDTSSGIWEDMWGEHMHHGYYVKGAKATTMEQHRAAQAYMINRCLEWGGIEEGPNAPKTAVDIGCGIGGSSRHINRRYGTATTGITLSPVQRERAQAISEASGVGDKCKFQVADALNTPFPSDSFDLVWSLESGEHMPHKPKFVRELVRICAPGGRVLLVTWCHRDLEDGETDLKPWEHKLLSKINKAYYLPQWCSTADYVSFFQEEGLADIKRADWSENVQIFWNAVIRSSLSWRGMRSLVRSGPLTIRGAIAMVYMVRGFKKGLVKFALVSGRKPSRS